MQSNLNILQLLNGSNKPRDPYPNNNYNQRPYPTRPNTQAQSNKEELENLKNRLEKVNQALAEKNKQKINDNIKNDNKNNVTDSLVPKPAEDDNTKDKNNGNTDSNDNGNVVISKKNWVKLTKSKFYFQVQPVVPEDEREAFNETVYYQN